MRYVETQSHFFLDIRVCLGTPGTFHAHAYDPALVCYVSKVVLNSVLNV